MNCKTDFCVKFQIGTKGTKFGSTKEYISISFDIIILLINATQNWSKMNIDKRHNSPKSKSSHRVRLFERLFLSDYAKNRTFLCCCRRQQTTTATKTGAFRSPAVAPRWVEGVTKFRRRPCIRNSPVRWRWCLMWSRRFKRCVIILRLIYILTYHNLNLLNTMYGTEMDSW